MNTLQHLLSLMMLLQKISHNVNRLGNESSHSFTFKSSDLRYSNTTLTQKQKRWRLKIDVAGLTFHVMLDTLIWIIGAIIFCVMICYYNWCTTKTDEDSIPLIEDETLLWRDPHYNQPRSIHHQQSDGYPHLPTSLFKSDISHITRQTRSGYRYNRTLCDHTILSDITIDSRGNICNSDTILNTGCCPLDSILNPTLGLKYCDGKWVDHVPWHLFEDNKCECYREHSYCIAGCMEHFVGISWDETKQDIYRWETCKYICSTSSKSTFRGQLFKDKEYRYCFGNQFYPSTEYGIFALLAPSLRTGISPILSCDEFCFESNPKSRCSPFTARMFSGQCEYHEMITGTKCNECSMNSIAAPSVKETPHDQMCTVSDEAANVCGIIPREDEEHLCLCATFVM